MEFESSIVEPTVAQMVAANHHAVNIFNKYSIDFCCGGKKTLDQVCTEKGMDANALRLELAALPEEDLLPSQDPYRWSLEFLIEYILQTHHRYLYGEMPLLRELTAKIARVHGERHPELRDVFIIYATLQEELETHMRKEEEILFPYIIRLTEAARTGQPLLPPPFSTAGNPVRMMEMEHETAGQLLERLHQLTGGYQPPAGACNSYRVTFAKLAHLEKDLHRHIFLENNILFPRALDLEREIFWIR